jgi:methionyl-tRNA formyltransferase
MRLVMLGTGPFAVPTFRALYPTKHDVVALVTAPPRCHRGRAIEPISCLRDLAEQHRTPIFDPDQINAPEAIERLASFRADLLVACDYGQILSAAALAQARWGGVNLHAALLPKYRGAAPINWAIYHGETETGLTVIHMSPQLDAGPCIAQVRTAIEPDETADQLEARLAELGTPLVLQAIDALATGSAEELPQDPTQAGKAPRLKKTDGLIVWNRPAAAIKNHVRAMEPWPRTYTFLHHAAEAPVRLILGPLAVVESPLADHPPGTVLEAAGSRLVITAGADAVMPLSIQPAGKRPMHVDEFLRGHRIQPGDRFGPESIPAPRPT